MSGIGWNVAATVGALSLLVIVCGCALMLAFGVIAAYLWIDEPLLFGSVSLAVVGVGLISYGRAET